MKFISRFIVPMLAMAVAFPLAAQSSPTLRFGLLPAESAIPLIVAQEKGFFVQQGVRVELTMFQSPVDRNIVLQTGKSDGAIADVMTVLAFKEAGLPVTATSDINEDFKVLSSPASGVTSMAQLNGKDVSLAPNFALEYIMDRIAQKNGVTYKLVNIPSIPARFEALLGNRITGVVFSEPQATQLISQGAKLLAASKDYGLKAGVLLFTDKFLKERPEAVKAFYRAYDQAVNYINTTPAADYSPAVVKFGFPPVVGDYLGLGAKYDKAAAVSSEMFDAIAAWCKTKGTVRKTWSLADAATARFLP